MGNLRIMTNEDKDFYCLLGPFLSRRKIVKEIGGTVWDDDGKSWIVCFEEDSTVGFCRFSYNHIGPVYVVPDERNKGIGTRMVKLALHNMSGEVFTISNYLSIEFYKKLGFDVVESKCYKRFAKMRYENG